jgi:hypothetical protein
MFSSFREFLRLGFDVEIFFVGKNTQEARLIYVVTITSVKNI